MTKATPPEFIEITLYPQGRVDLVEFSNALLALNAEYRDWLRQHPEFDHKDRNLRLYVEKLDNGSIKIWLTQAYDSLLNGPLAGFSREYLQDFIGSLARGIAEFATRKKVTNTDRLIRWKFDWQFISPKIRIKGKMSFMELRVAQNNLKILKADNGTERANKQVIRFKSFHTDGNARTIASKYSDAEVKTLLEHQVRKIFLNADENIFKDGKEFLVDMNVTRKHGEIESYRILKVHRSI